jgi:hypothetical protein
MPSRYLEDTNYITVISTYHFGKLGILDHHSLDDAEESFVAWEKARSACEGIPLEHALTGVFGENLDDAPAFGAGGDVPLEVPAAVFKHGIELVRYQLIGREDAEARWIPNERYGLGPS